MFSGVQRLLRGARGQIVTWWLCWKMGEVFTIVQIIKRMNLAQILQRVPPHPLFLVTAHNDRDVTETQRNRL